MPALAVDEDIHDSIYLTFRIDANGKVIRACACSSSGMDSLTSMEKEAIRVIMHFPQWIPGKQNGKNVAVRYRLPIRF